MAVVANDASAFKLQTFTVIMKRGLLLVAKNRHTKWHAQAPLFHNIPESNHSNLAWVLGGDKLRSRGGKAMIDMITSPFPSDLAILQVSNL